MSVASVNAVGSAGFGPHGLIPHGLIPRGLIHRGLIHRGLIPRGLASRGCCFCSCCCHGYRISNCFLFLIVEITYTRTDDIRPVIFLQPGQNTVVGIFSRQDKGGAYSHPARCDEIGNGIV